MKKILLILCFLLLPNLAFANTIKELSSTDFLRILTEEKGKIIIVNFFASWCPPCVFEMPDFIKIREEFKENELLILGLSLDDDIKALDAFVDDMKLNFPVYKASDELAYAYRVSTIPHTIIYSKELTPLFNRAGIMRYDFLKTVIEENL